MGAVVGLLAGALGAALIARLYWPDPTSPRREDGVGELVTVEGNTGLYRIERAYRRRGEMAYLVRRVSFATGYVPASQCYLYTPPEAPSE
jgi:hypothetical protein